MKTNTLSNRYDVNSTDMTQITCIYNDISHNYHSYDLRGYKSLESFVLITFPWKLKFFLTLFLSWTFACFTMELFLEDVSESIL